MSKVGGDQPGWWSQGSTRKLSYRKEDRAMRPIYECPETFRESLSIYAHGYFSRNFYWAFVPIDPMNTCTKFEVRSFESSEHPILEKRMP